MQSNIPRNEQADSVKPRDVLADLSPSADLEAVLVAWHQATLRLEQTHSLLQNEVRRLAQELEVKNRELQRKNRLADLGQFAAHMAHEVRNHMMPVTLYLSLLRRQLGGSPACETLAKVESGFTALDATVTDLLYFARDDEPKMESFRLFELVREIVVSISPQLEAQHIAATIDIPFNLQLTADQVMVRRSVLNLMLNALDVMPQGGQLVFTGYSDGEQVELEVADSGPGISSSAIPRLFEPFFTSKSHGTGLGLAIVERVAVAHGGQVIAQNCPDGGAAFTLTFPVRHRRPMALAAA